MRQTEQPRPTVYIVDDHTAVRDAVRWLVEQIGLRAKTFRSAKEFLDDCHSAMRGCLVLDVQMPGMSGLQLQDRLKEKGVTLPVIIITGHGDVPVTVRAMKAGAFEFLQKPFSDQALLDSINAAIEQHNRICEEQDRRGRAESSLESLTKREREVLKLLRIGKHNKVIAAELGISVRTVEGHRARIMDKLGVKSFSQLVEIAIKAFPEA